MVEAVQCYDGYVAQSTQAPNRRASGRVSGVLTQNVHDPGARPAAVRSNRGTVGEYRQYFWSVIPHHLDQPLLSRDDL